MVRITIFDTRTRGDNWKPQLERVVVAGEVEPTRAGNGMVQRRDELATTASMNCFVFGPTVDMYGGMPYCHVDGLDIACLRQA